MPHYDDLNLYYRTSCPYSVKVLRFMEANDITMNMCDTTQPGNLEKLVSIGGNRQVPCLVIDGKALYESDDIIKYLQDRIG